MNYTFVTRCNCGCDTSDTIQVSGPTAESALALLRSQWDEEERDVEVLAAFEGTPRQAQVLPRA